MDHTNHPLEQACELRLLAAAIELQHITNTGSNIVQIPGGARVIAIGVPADVARRLESPALARRAPAPVCADGLILTQAAFEKIAATFNGYLTEAGFDIGVALRDEFKRLAIRSATKAQISQPGKITITLRQAHKLVEFFGGHDTSVTVTPPQPDWERQQPGLYAYCTEYPEDGSWYLGPTEINDDLTRLDAEGAKARAQQAAPAPKPVADKDMREVVRDAVAGALSGLYYCGRVWSAWGVGTMSKSDFSPADEDDDIIENVADAAINAMGLAAVFQAAPAQHYRKATTELSLPELAEQFAAVAKLGGEYTLSAGVCAKLYEAMTTPPAAPAQPATDQVEAAVRRRVFAEIGEKLRANIAPKDLAEFVDAERMKPVRATDHATGAARAEQSGNAAAAKAGELPDWSDAKRAVEQMPGAGEATPLDIFIYNNEPAGDSVGTHFRAQLQAVIDYVAADRSPATDHATGAARADDPLCPACQGSGEGMMMEGAGPDAYEVPCNCPYCKGSGGLLDAYHGLVDLLDAERKVFWANRAATPSPSAPQVQEGAPAEESERRNKFQVVASIADWPEKLHHETTVLVIQFAAALAQKLAAAESKYGYHNGWADKGWMDECRAQLVHHLAKGDPRDVANYCAFLWWHGESTATPVAGKAPAAASTADTKMDATPSAPAVSEKAIYWFSVLVKCARLLDVPDDEPIPSGVLHAVEKLLATQPAAASTPMQIGQANERAQEEAAAKAIYQRFDGATEHPWVERGNSNKQDEARLYARAALSAITQPAASTPSAPVDDKWMLGFEAGKRVGFHLATQPAASSGIGAVGAAGIQSSADDPMRTHFTCEAKTNNACGISSTLYFTKIGAHGTFQFYRNEVETLWLNIGAALGIADTAPADAPQQAADAEDAVEPRRIQLSKGHTLRREDSFGSQHWMVYGQEGEFVRALTQYENEFVESAIRAAMGTPQQAASGIGAGEAAQAQPSVAPADVAHDHSEGGHHD